MHLIKQHSIQLFDPFFAITGTQNKVRSQKDVLSPLSEFCDGHTSFLLLLLILHFLKQSLVRLFKAQLALFYEYFASAYKQLAQLHVLVDLLQYLGLITARFLDAHNQIFFEFDPKLNNLFNDG